MKAEILCHLFLSPQYWQLLDTEEAPKFGRWINEWIQFINNPVNSTSKIEAKLVYFSPIHCLDLSSYHSHLNGSSSPLPTLPTSTLTPPPCIFHSTLLTMCSVSDHILSYVKLSKRFTLLSGLNSFKALHDLLSTKLSNFILYCPC